MKKHQNQFLYKNDDDSDLDSSKRANRMSDQINYVASPASTARYDGQQYDHLPTGPDEDYDKPDDTRC